MVSLVVFPLFCNDREMQGILGKVRIGKMDLLQIIMQDLFGHLIVQHGTKVKGTSFSKGVLRYSGIGSIYRMRIGSDGFCCITEEKIHPFFSIRGNRRVSL